MGRPRYTIKQLNRFADNDFRREVFVFLFKLGIIMAETEHAVRWKRILRK